MPFDEAKEHAPGRLHNIFAAPSAAFDNTNPERRLHLRIALEKLLLPPYQQKQLRLRVIHGWENGDYAPEDLRYGDHSLHAQQDLSTAIGKYYHASQQLPSLAGSKNFLLVEPLNAAIAKAEAQGQTLEADIRQHPASWPTFKNGLYLYTFFKVYHRLIYGEDEPYRSIYCKTSKGGQEIHEFHIEEGEFAICTPSDPASREPTLLIMHASQMEPLEEFLNQYL